MSARRPVDQRLVEIGTFLRHSEDRHAYFSESFSDDLIEDLGALVQCGDDSALLKLVKDALENPGMRLGIARANAEKKRRVRAESLACDAPDLASPSRDPETGIARWGSL